MHHIESAKSTDSCCKFENVQQRLERQNYRAWFVCICVSVRGRFIISIVVFTAIYWAKNLMNDAANRRGEAKKSLEKQHELLNSYLI